MKLAHTIANSLMINLGDMLQKDDFMSEYTPFVVMRSNDKFTDLVKGFIKIIIYPDKEKNTHYAISAIKKVKIDANLLADIYKILDSKTKADIIKFRLDAISKSIQVNYQQCASFIKGTIAKEIKADANFPFKDKESFRTFRTKSPNTAMMVEDTIKMFMFITSGGDMQSSSFQPSDIRKTFKIDSATFENIMFELDELKKEDFI